MKNPNVTMSNVAILTPPKHYSLVILYLKLYVMEKRESIIYLKLVFQKGVITYDVWKMR
mgnify:CR=1 FL=1